MREINKIIIHCSDSLFGDRDIIDTWHRNRGFKEIGYHYVILNGRIKYADPYDQKIDGILQIGRDIKVTGAHCQGDNKDSIGICLIGTNRFTIRQNDKLIMLINDLRETYGNHIKVFGHYEMKSGIKQGKTCPNIDMVKFRKEYLKE